MSILDHDLTSLAFCWRMERRDGVSIGFTTHDRDLEIEHLTYRAAPGMLPSAITLSDGFEADSLEVSGALTSDAISAVDLDEGRWDGASVFIFLIDWERPDGARVHLARGELGDVSASGTSFTAELRGPTAALDRPVVEQTSPECRAALGDKRCRVDMAGRVRITRIAEVQADDGVAVVEAVSASNAYAYGRVKWLTGPNSGLESAILSSAGTQLRLREPPPHRPAAGDLVEITEGCDRSFDTCAGRFGNGVNFRGEPYLPGMDLLTRYPGS